MKKTQTTLIHTRKARLDRSIVNPPIERASTVLFDNPSDLYGAKPTYGRMGLTVHRELEAALASLEKADHVKLTSNGLQACTLAIASLVQADDHVLISDSLYGPSARFCEKRLPKMGVETERFDPCIGDSITDHFKPNTKAIFLESPGSLTFEIADTPAIVSAAKQRGIKTIMDNTWGAGLHHKPLELGVDVSVQALTKYIVGHADAFAGAVMTRDSEIASAVLSTAEDWGIGLSPDDAYLALRGLRTLEPRLKAHEAAGLEIAHWLLHRPEVTSVIHPALPSHPQHEIWSRDFSGSNGLFGFVLQPVSAEALDRFYAALTYFGLGFSWGGFESLIIPCDQQLTRKTNSRYANADGHLMRIHVGLESVEDLLSDLEGALNAMSGLPAS